MNSRIKEHNDNVIHVNFTPEELSEDYLVEEENKMFKEFKRYENKNMMVAVVLSGISISLIVAACIFFFIASIIL